MDLILYAIPVFLLSLVLEWASYRFLPDDDERGYERRDTATSLSMGVGNVVVGAGWKFVTLAVFAGAYAVSPYHLSASDPLTWVLLFLVEDFSYYWFHRVHHEVRVFWASHVVHHSSQFYNLSTALRQSWTTPMTGLPFWVPLAFVVPPWMLLTQQSISLLYQFFLHTERIDRMWRPVELVMNTPSHHRVHHGANLGYLDRNYGGILIVWDRMFGTFRAEDERVVYGLTKNIETFNPVRVAFHEFGAIWADLRRARTWRTRFGHLLRGPGWVPGA